MATHAMQAQRTILIIDDDKHTRSLLRKSFEKAGFLVITSENGRKGVEQAIVSMPDIVLSDVVMPEMNGYEVCRTLKGHPATRDIPMILLTARGDTDSTLEGFLAGADEYIAKPFEIQEVLARVQRVCRWVEKQQESTTRLSGSLDKTPMFELLRFCEDHRISGIIRLTRVDEAGVPLVGIVRLQLGEIAAIELGSHTDMTEALDELLTWTEGTFVVKQEELQLPGDDAAATPEPAPLEAETAAGAPASESAPDMRPEPGNAAHLAQPLRRILEELKADADELEHAVVADESGQVISAIGDSASPEASEQFGRLLAGFLRLSRAIDQQLRIGPLQEGLILSEHDLFLVAPVDNLGALGVTSAKEHQGMMRWNCKETVEKIRSLLT